jgi:hypothetical protein
MGGERESNGAREKEIYKRRQKKGDKREKVTDRE